MRAGRQGVCVVGVEVLGRSLPAQPVDGVVVLFNLSQLTMKHTLGPLMTYASECMSLDEKHYPELLAWSLVFNAPKVFTVLFAMVKPLLDPVTLSKLCVAGPAWQPECAKWVPLSSLPAEWGGTGAPWVKEGGPWVPMVDEDGQQHATVQVEAGGTVAVPIEVLEGYSLHWRVTCVDYDIGVGLVRVLEAREAVVERVKRHNAHEAAVVGCASGLKGGTYRLTLDNSYSWTTAKTAQVWYYSQAPLTKEQKAKK